MHSGLRTQRLRIRDLLREELQEQGLYWRAHNGLENIQPAEAAICGWRRELKGISESYFDITQSRNSGEVSPRRSEAEILRSVRYYRYIRLKQEADNKKGLPDWLAARVAEYAKSR